MIFHCRPTDEDSSLAGRIALSDGKRIQTDLQFLSIGRFNRDADSDSRGRLRSCEFTLKDCLAPRKSHKPYAEALLEIDSSKLARSLHGPRGASWPRCGRMIRGPLRRRRVPHCPQQLTPRFSG